MSVTTNVTHSEREYPCETNDMESREPLRVRPETTPSMYHSTGLERAAEEVPLNEIHFWTPFCLRRATLISFMVAVVLMIAALEVLYQVSAQNQGLVSTASNKHYLWAYGPTAVFTLVSSFWVQVAYHTALLMPWKVIRTRSTWLDPNVSLDYRSSSAISVLWSSAKNRHFAVLMAVVGTYTILLVTVLSTGIFTLETIAFTTADAHAIATEQYIGPNIPYNSDGAVDVDGSAVLNTIGIMSENLSYPRGTDARYAVQDFELVNHIQSPGSTLAADVNGTSVSLTCETASIESVTLYSGDAESYTRSEGSMAMAVNFSTSSYQLLSTGCDIPDQASDSCFAAGFMGFNTTSGITGTGSLAECTNVHTRQNESCWFFFYGSYERPLTDSAWQELQENTNHSKTLSPHGWLDSSALLCQTAYIDGSIHVKVDSSNSIIERTPNVAQGNNTYEKTFIDKLTSSCMSYFQLSEMNLEPTDSWGSSNVFFDTFFDILDVSIPEANFSSLLEDGALAEACDQVYSAVYAQAAKQYFFATGNDTNPMNETFKATYNTLKQRLVVHSASARIVESLLAALIVIAIGMCIFTTTSSTPVNPETFGGLAYIMATDAYPRGASSQNPTPCSTSDSEDCAKADDVKTRVWTKSAREKSPEGTGETSIDFFTSVYFTLPVKLLITSIPLLMIAILEITYAISCRSKGLATVSAANYQHFAWTVLPALLLSGIGLVFNSVASTIRMLYPLAVLKKGTADLKTSLFEINMSQHAVVAFTYALFRGETALAAILLSNLLTPLLTIFVSGLFTTQILLVSTSTFSLPRSDAFDLSLLNSNTTYPIVSAYEANLLVRKNISYPAGTYQNLLLPNIPSSTDGILQYRSTGNETSFRLSLEALRLTQSCNITEDEQLSAQICSDSYTGSDLDSLDIEINPDGSVSPYITYPGLANCRCMNNNKNICGNVTPAFRFADSSDLPGYFSPDFANGPSEVLYVEKDRCLNLARTTTTQMADALKHPDPGSCPTYTLLWGYASNTTIDQLHGFSCTPYFESVNVTATYALQDMSLISTDVDENSVKPYNSTNWIDLINLWGLSAIPTIDDTMMEDYSYAGDDVQVLELIFELLSSDGSTLGPSNIDIDPSLIMSTYERLYAEYYVQFINRNVRSPAESDALPFAGTMLASETRLMQNEVSTRILQSLLAILSICAAVAFIAFDPRHLSPKKPCSIATQMGLLAGEDEQISGLIPEGMGQPDQKTLETVFKDHFYSLGWWDNKDGGRRFGIGIGRAEVGEAIE